MRVTFTLIVTLIVALIAETSMNKGIQTNYESMRAKSLLNFFRGCGRVELLSITVHELVTES